MADDQSVKIAFHTTLNGLQVTVQGITAHKEALTEQGVIEIWNALKLADLKVVAQP